MLYVAEAYPELGRNGPPPVRVPGSRLSKPRSASEGEDSLDSRNASGLSHSHAMTGSNSHDWESNPYMPVVLTLGFLSTEPADCPLIWHPLSTEYVDWPRVLHVLQQSLLLCL